MKNIIIMSVTGLSLFVGTAVGVLGVQGRLNHEGTKGIPVLHSLFPAPPVEEAESEGDDPHADHPAPAVETVPQKDLTLPSSGTELRQGQSIKDDGKSGGGGHGGGHGEDPAPAHEEDESKKSTKALTTPQEDWQQQELGLRGSPDAFYQFPTREIALTVEEINDIRDQAKKKLEDAELRSAALKEKERDLSRREKNLADNQERLTDFMQKIREQSDDLDRRVAEFKQDVLLISKNEKDALQDQAKFFSAYDPQGAAELVLSLWETEAGRVKAAKILSLMPIEEVAAITAEMTPKMVNEITDAMGRVTERRN